MTKQPPSQRRKSLTPDMGQAWREFGRAVAHSRIAFEALDQG